MVTIKATLFLDRFFWVVTFERVDKKGYSIARKIFGAEPQDSEIYGYILKNYHELNFGIAKEFKLIVKRMNPKRVQKNVRREMEKIKESSKSSTFAQDYMREEIEKNKKEKKILTKKEKEALKEKQFLLKVEKRKEKHRGH